MGGLPTPLMEDEMIFEYRGTKYCIEDLLFAANEGKLLKDACYNLLNNVKNRYPQEDRTMWKCPDFNRISELIHFK